tara:strand:- start:1084 stop:1353 length:270 start_codon:yes stop_codon:yes gene_type:complete
MNKVINQINQISNKADLQLVINALRQKQNELNAQAVMNAKASFRVGDEVLCRSKAGVERAIIKEMKIKKAVIEIAGKLYNCRLDMLEAA